MESWLATELERLGVDDPKLYGTYVAGILADSADPALDPAADDVLASALEYLGPTGIEALAEDELDGFSVRLRAQWLASPVENERREDGSGPPERRTACTESQPPKTEERAQAAGKSDRPQSSTSVAPSSRSSSDLKATTLALARHFERDRGGGERDRAQAAPNNRDAVLQRARNESARHPQEKQAEWREKRSARESREAEATRKTAHRLNRSAVAAREELAKRAGAERQAACKDMARRRREKAAVPA